MTNQSYKRYMMVVQGGYIVILAYLCFAYLYLVAGGENLSLGDIAQKQQKNHLLYYSALHENTPLYKLSLYKLIKPDIITLGSSRMLQFRGEDFKESFVNMGLSMSVLAQGHEMADEMLKVHVPKIVILGADFWWFSSQKEGVVTLKQQDLTASDAMETALWIFQRKISPKSMLKTIITRPTGYGLGTIVWKDGYDRYGSYHYTSLMEGRRPSYYTPEEVAQDFMLGKNVQHYKDDFNPARLQSFVQLINKFVRAGSHVIVIIPPNYPDANRELSATGKKLIGDFRTAMRRLPVRAYDFHDAGIIGSGPCEFINVWHGGEVTYLRILRALAASDPSIAATVDTRKINALISANAGRAEIVRSGYPIQHEVDFLGIGCAKGEHLTGQL